MMGSEKISDMGMGYKINKEKEGRVLERKATIEKMRYRMRRQVK